LVGVFFVVGYFSNPDYFNLWNIGSAEEVARWKRHPLVGKSEEDVRKSFGRKYVYWIDSGPLGKLEGWPLIESDGDFVYEGTRLIHGRPEARIVVCFLKGKCIGVVEGPTAARFHKVPM